MSVLVSMITYHKATAFENFAVKSLSLKFYATDVGVPVKRWINMNNRWHPLTTFGSLWSSRRYDEDMRNCSLPFTAPLLQLQTSVLLKFLLTLSYGHPRRDTWSTCCVTCSFCNFVNLQVQRHGLDSDDKSFLHCKLFQINHQDIKLALRS